MRNIPAGKQNPPNDLSTHSNSSYRNKVDGVDLSMLVDDIARDSLILYGSLQMAWQDYESNLKDTFCLDFLSNIASLE